MLVAPVAAIDHDSSLVAFQIRQGGDQVEQRLLAERLHDHVGGDHEVGAGQRLHAARAGIVVVELGSQEFDAPARRRRSPSTRIGWANHSNRTPSDRASSYS